MLQYCKRISLSVILLTAAALTLLLSDLQSRDRSRKTSSAEGAQRRVAILKHASNRLLDELEAGVLEQLAAAGYRDGGRIRIQRFSAEGDLPTANAIAKQITDGSYAMAITISTLSLQCVANANKDGRAVHVFGGVTDPVAAGVGIQRMDSLDKPRWLAGIGTFQPIEQILRQAQQLWPGLKTVGVVWNPAERNSEICTLKARAVCRTLGLQLLEATVDQSKDVREAADSLVARGVQAFWTGTDVTVLNATATLCESAQKARIPVFSNSTGQIREGSLFDLGANYQEVGNRMGSLAASILDGQDPATMPVTNFMPERVMLNKQVLKRMRDPWRFPDALIARAAVILGEDGRTEKDTTQVARMPTLPAGRKFQVALAYFGPDEGVEPAIAGLRDGLAKLGLVEGNNLTLQRSHASGEIGGIPAMLHALDAGPVDAIATFSTPVLTAACAGVRHKPVVFTYCSDPLAAGVGKSFTEHLPFVTGVGSFPPVEEAVLLMKQTLPGFRRLGTLYNNAEANSVKVVSVLRELCQKHGLELLEATANSTSEVVPAAQALVTRQAQAVYLPGDNTAYQAFDGLAGQMAKARVPLVIDAPEYLERGALAVVGIGFYQSGLAAAEPLVRVLAGQSPGQIPIRNVAEKRVLLNPATAAKLGLRFPAAVRAMQTTAAQPAAATQPPAKRWRIHQISYTESLMVEDATRGFRDGLKASGLVEGRDFTFKELSAQGDMATLGSLFDSAQTAGTDLYLVFSTPTLQTALRKVHSTPVLFTVVADPFVAGAGKSDTEHVSNVTGVYTQGPYREIVELVHTHFPQIKRVGTLYCPAESNSVANKEFFVREAQRCGMTVETVPANHAGDLPDAALALCSRRLDAVVQILDNISVPGFPTIARAAAQARLPVFTCLNVGVQQGAAVAVARDYYEAGRETALQAAQVMRGTSPAQIPFAPPSKSQTLVNPQNAKRCGLTIPPALMKTATLVTEGPAR